jgi:hypothetical protein
MLKLKSGVRIAGFQHFNAKGLKLIIVVPVQVRAVKIYVAAMEVALLKKKEGMDEDRIKLSVRQNRCFSDFLLGLHANVLFCHFLKL